MSQADFKTLSRQMAGREGFGGSAILAVVLVLIVALLTWAKFAELDNVTRGTGRVVSAAQNQLVQAAEAGVILRRYVTENSAVQKGELLFELDPVEAESEFNQARQREAALSLREARLKAELNETAYSVAPDLAARSPEVAQSEESLFRARQTDLAGQIAVLEQRRAQRVQDRQSAEATVEAMARTMALLEEEITVVEPLVREKIAPATRLLELQRELERARGEHDRAKVAIAQAQSGINEIDSETAHARESYRLQAIDELTKVMAERSELEEALPQLRERVSRTVVTAPMDGIVNRLNFRTPGGYVNRGDVLLEMVPTGEGLIVEGRIEPKDISSLRVDDQVRIRFSAYDSAKYGAVDGRLTRISPDAMVDEQAGGQSYYLVDVAIEGELLVNEKPVTFLPGMTATIDILSGKRTVLEYLWQPMAKVQELALRD
ncbi:adhesin transport system membrane fusion protein [Rhodobacter sp. JA431]|uniref:HlyD family type I secretion periplasmic adaptor subunit n=1 Tax=Rhodobacter sp. JA431 TaxID=570013 RepID=UPI000BD9B6AE|nr:HlyD family type I secretion periplasmic adaptor subunit [Rhodobacter sp. JA431]SOC00549.1 adhesin transport system membrane fusion protein [Rhodobacter sp. JA431]